MLLNFHLTDEQKDITKAARNLPRKNFRTCQECDRKESPASSVEKACDLGFVASLSLKLMEDRAGYMEHCLIHEEFWRVDPDRLLDPLNPFGSEMILLFGTEEQKKKRLLRSSTKSHHRAAITEPDAGSDVSSVLTKPPWRVMPISSTGTRYHHQWHESPFPSGLCITEPEARSSHDRFSVITVETDRPGLEATKLRNKLGIRASDTQRSRLATYGAERNLIGTADGDFSSSWFSSITPVSMSAPRRSGSLREPGAGR